MSERHYLSSLFEPKSVAVIGASERPDSAGQILFHNLAQGGYKGKIYPINPRHPTVLGHPAYKSVEEVGAPIDLALIATKAKSVPEIVEQCGRCGIRNVIIVSAGFADAGPTGANLERKTLEIARNYGMHVLGPNSSGILRPHLALNASLSRIRAETGKLALLSHSGALGATVLDWARSQRLGFSCVAMLGNTAGLDYGDILDYLANDPRTHAILIHIEGTRHARPFLSALRSAARSKPILLLKAGRHAAGAVPGLPLADERAFDAAVRRAGVVRVDTLGQLLCAAKAQEAKFRPQGKRLAIVTNGGGPGALAADCARALGLSLAELAAPTSKALNAVLPGPRGRRNPLDIADDATPARYRDAILAVARDPGVDGILVMLAPQATTDASATALAVIEAGKQTTTPIVACWMGEEQVRAGRILLAEAGIPAFALPETALELYRHVSTYYREQKLHQRTPQASSLRVGQESEGARMLIEAVQQERRTVLSEMESKAVLHAFGIPVAQTMVARSLTEAILLAEQIGFPVVMKIDSPDILHKSAAGGVRLKLPNAPAVRNAYHDILETVRRKRPEARINGVAIEPHLERPHGRELMISIARDPLFGPVIRFGAGGNGVEVFNDRVVAVPPLDRAMARELIAGTRAAHGLGTFHEMPPANLEALEDVLLDVSAMICELPWLRELKLDPLLVDEHGAIAADARIIIDPAAEKDGRYSHMAIHPYPAHLAHDWEQPDGRTVCIRPIRPEDAEIEQEFVKALSDESKYFRFMDSLRELTPAMLVRFTQIDYDREMAFVATIPDEEGKLTQIGVARYVTTPDGESVEFALAVADSWQRRGLGRTLMSTLIDCAHQRGYKTMLGDILTNNTKMFRLVGRLGFTVHPHPDDPSVKRVILPLAG